MRVCKFLGYVLILISATPLLALAAADKASQEVRLRGRVVCTDDQGHVVECGPASEQFALRTDEGKVLRFLNGSPSSAIFTDARVRERELQIFARLHPDNRLESIKVHSIHDRKFFDLYYFCEVCNITAYAPGLCPCCRDELEFKEKPLEK